MSVESKNALQIADTRSHFHLLVVLWSSTVEERYFMNGLSFIYVVAADVQPEYLSLVLEPSGSASLCAICAWQGRPQSRPRCDWDMARHDLHMKRERTGTTDCCFSRQSTASTLKHFLS